MLNCPKGIFSFSFFPHYDKPKNRANTQLISSIKFISCCYCKTKKQKQTKNLKPEGEFPTAIRTVLSFLQSHKTAHCQPSSHCCSWELLAQLGNGNPTNLPLDHREAQHSITWPCRDFFFLDFTGLEKEAEATDL